MKLFKKSTKSIALLTAVLMLTLTAIMPIKTEEKPVPGLNVPDVLYIQYNDFV